MAHAAAAASKSPVLAREVPIAVPATTRAVADAEREA